MSAPTKKCEICGEEISNLQYKKHMATHETVAEPVAEIVTPKQDNNDTPKFADPALEKLYKRGLQMQEKLLSAPEVLLGEDSSDQHKTLKKVHCPESLGAKAEWECVFVSAKSNPDGYAASGYLPVVDEHGQQVKDSIGMPMWKIRKSIYEARKEIARKESRRRVNAVTQEAAKRSVISGSSPDHRSGDIREELLSIRKRTEE